MRSSPLIAWKLAHTEWDSKLNTLEPWILGRSGIASLENYSLQRHNHPTVPMQSRLPHVLKPWFVPIQRNKQWRRYHAIASARYRCSVSKCSLFTRSEAKRSDYEAICGCFKNARAQEVPSYAQYRVLAGIEDDFISVQRQRGIMAKMGADKTMRKA